VEKVLLFADTDYKIQNGNWDKNTSDPKLAYKQNHPSEGIIPIKDWFFYESAYEHFINDISWEDTPMWEQYPKNKASSHSEKLSAIYNSMKEHGYLTVEERIQRPHFNPKHNWLLHPNYKFRKRVNIGLSRDNVPIFLDGKHRFCIAKILGINNLPVTVRRIHKDLLSVDHIERLPHLPSSAESA